MKLTLTGWLIVGAACVVLFLGAAFLRPSFLGFTFDPFGLNASALRNAEARAAHATLDASARSLEAAGEREQAQRLDTYSHVLIQTEALSAAAQADARNAPDANTPLEAGRADRLRRVDDGLCNTRHLPGCPAAPVAP